MDKNEIELKILSYIVQYPARMREIIEAAAINGEMFQDEKCRAAFLELMAEESESSLSLAAKVLSHLPELDHDRFLDLGCDIQKIEYNTYKFASAAVMRELRREQSIALTQSAGFSEELVLEREEQLVLDAKAKIAALNAVIFKDGSETVVDSGGIPATDPKLLNVPGFVNELVEYSMRVAPRPNRVLSFTGALSMLAHLSGRKFIGPRDSRPNIYLIALAGSGVGKDIPQRINRTIALLERIDVSIIGRAASGQGLEDALLRTPTLLCQIDEFDTVLETLKSPKNSNAATEALWSMLLTMFSESGSTHITRMKAANSKGDSGGLPVYQPSVSLYASAIPSRFYKTLTERACTNGLVGRCLVLEAGERGDENLKSGDIINPMPQSIKRMVSYLANTGYRVFDNRPVEARDLIRVEYGEGAEDEAAKISKEVDILFKKAEREQDEMEKSVWNRSIELIGKLALLYAISESLVDMRIPVISKDAVKWAWKLVKSLQLRMIAMIGEYSAVDEMDANVKKVLRLIRSAGKRGISRSKVGQTTRLSADLLDRIESTLLDRNEIEVQSLPASKNGKTTKHYCVKNKKKK